MSGAEACKQNLRFNVNGREFAVRDSAAGTPTRDTSGTPFLWGHCLLGSMAQDDDAALLHWDEIEKRVRLLRYDARGHGASQPSHDEANHRYPEMTQDLLGVADALGAERFAVGGVSMGCALGIHAAVAAPERVSALVLMAPPTAWDTRPRQRRIYHFTAALVRVIGFWPLRFVGSLAEPGGHHSPAVTLVRSMISHAAELDRRSAVSAFRGAAASDLPSPEALRRIEQPTLILAWDDDPGHPMSTAELLAEYIPNAELRCAAELHDAQDWTQRVLEFLEANGS